jgi:maleylpyruvate isomerase
MQLYSYFRSSAAYRVRIALNLKGLSYDYMPVHLLKEGGQQLKPEYTRLNPQALVPTLVDGQATLTQSLTIIEYLDETHPEPPLLAATPLARARVRELAQSIACDIHPLNNLRVLRYLKRELDVPDEKRDAWYRHWIETGLQALERMLADSPETGTYCHGDTPTLADICLIPQVFNARRLKCDMSAMPTIVRIDTACRALPAFVQAAPEHQPDAE